MSAILRGRIVTAERNIRARDIRRVAAAVGMNFQEVERWFSAIEYVIATDPSITLPDGGVDREALHRRVVGLRT